MALDEGAVALPLVAVKLRVAPGWRAGSKVVAEQLAAWRGAFPFQVPGVHEQAGRAGQAPQGVQWMASLDLHR
eukprot:10792926-Alexandrium_andersonii.AAC.1